MSVRIKNQHYVPRFLLRCFAATEATKKLPIHCFDKLKGHTFKAAPERVCAEQSFHDIDGDQGAEIEISKIEDKLSNCHEALVRARNIADLSTGEKTGIATLIAFQHVRTRACRNIVMESSKLVVRKLNEKQKSESPEFKPPPGFNLETEEAAKIFQLNMIGNIVPKFAASLMNMKWCLLINNTDVPYWCSDNPFTVYNPFPYNPNDGKGFKRSASQTYFPVSSDLSLSISDKRHYSHMEETIDISDVNNVIFNNHLQIKGAERFVFSMTNNFELASSMINEEPSLRTPNIGRFDHLDIDSL